MNTLTQASLDVQKALENLGVNNIGLIIYPDNTSEAQNIFGGFKSVTHKISTVIL